MLGHDFVVIRLAVQVCSLFDFQLQVSGSFLGPCVFSYCVLLFQDWSAFQGLSDTTSVCVCVCVCV